MSHQPIHAQIWSPLDKSLFKHPARDPATCRVFYCEKADTCSLLKKGQCIHSGFLSPKCPHGYVSGESGPTKASRKCGVWVAEQRKKYGQYIGKVSASPPDKMVEIGDWVYLPYAHLDMNDGIPILGKSSLFISGKPFIKKEEFTISVITCIVNFRPQALMGGEIKSYQSEVVPKFLAHLEEVYPEKYKELLEANPTYVERFKLTTKSYIGRVALLKTTKPALIDIGKHTFQWTGTVLNSVKFDTLWIDIVDENRTKAIETINVTVVPTDKTVIKIHSNDQVDKNTVFVD